MAGVRHCSILFLGLLLVAPAWAGVRSSTQRIHLGPIPDGATPFVYAPFDVPAGTVEVVVHVDYDRADYENIVDFAIFDARFSGRSDDLTGYRGKNPNRTPLVSIIGRTRASDGHIPGPMPAGTWRVMFFVYRTLPGGVDVTLNISLAVEGETFVSTSEPGWIRGDLHAHTLHSDGSWTVTSLAAAAQAAGLDFIAVTDHNTTSHHPEIDAMPAGGPLLIRGIELTSYGGHANLWGVPAGRMVEYRQLPGDPAAVPRMVAEAHGLGAVISLNHPFAICKACGWSLDTDAAGFDGMEVWNGTWAIEDEQALAWWDRLLRAGRRITAVGSSDSHGPQNPVGSPTMRLRAESREVGAVLAAVRSGRAILTASPEIEVGFEIHRKGARFGPGDEVAPGEGQAELTATLRGVSSGEAVLFSSEGEVRRWTVLSGTFRAEITVAATPRYYRLEVRDAKGAMAALTNPIWLRH